MLLLDAATHHVGFLEPGSVLQCARGKLRTYEARFDSLPKRQRCDLDFPLLRECLMTLCSAITLAMHVSTPVMTPPNVHVTANFIDDSCIGCSFFDACLTCLIPSFFAFQSDLNTHEHNVFTSFLPNQLLVCAPCRSIQRQQPQQP